MRDLKALCDILKPPLVTFRTKTVATFRPEKLSSSYNWQWPLTIYGSPLSSLFVTKPVLSHYHRLSILFMQYRYKYGQPYEFTHQPLPNLDEAYGHDVEATLLDLILGYLLLGFFTWGFWICSQWAYKKVSTLVRALK